MAGGAEQDGGGGGRRRVLLALVFPVFVAVLALAVLVLVGGVLVLFVLAAMLVFLPLVFPAAAAMLGRFLGLLAISCCLLLVTTKGSVCQFITSVFATCCRHRH